MRKYVNAGVLFSSLILGGCSISEHKKSDLVFTANTMTGDAETVNLCTVERPQLSVEPEPTVTRPYSADLFFITNSDLFNSDSARDAENIYQDVVALNADKIILIGYTDTVGSIQSNETLSKRRVERVKQDLLARGITESVISVDWHGEAHLSVETGDNVDEQKNRRVEIYVR
jgi:outer membrane protein OmpA-like peptidoglycan-associated protein